MHVTVILTAPCGHVRRMSYAAMESPSSEGLSLKKLIPIFFAVILAVCLPCQAKPSPDQLRRPVVTLSAASDGPSGRPFCTGVAVASHVVWTALHCVTGPLGFPSIPYFNGWGCKGDRIIATDGTDNALVRTCVEFKHTARIARGQPAIGSPVQLWGHVFGLPLQYRRGYLSSIIPDQWHDDSNTVYVWDMQAAGGDSGGPFYNDKGEVMCVTSFGILRGNWPHFGLVACYPPRFTTKQLELIK